MKCSFRSLKSLSFIAVLVGALSGCETTNTNAVSSQENESVSQKNTQSAIPSGIQAIGTTSITGNAGQVIEVTTTGTAPTADEATKAAIRAAVEQAVGQLVDASTLVNNDEVVSDKILSYSGGFVEGFDVLKEPSKGEDGLFSTKIKARVRKTQLTKKLKESNISVNKVDGGGLFAEALTKTDEIKNAAEILENELKMLPSKLMHARVTSKPVFKPDTGIVLFDVEISIDADDYNKYVEGLKNKLDKIAIHLKTIRDIAWTIPMSNGETSSRQTNLGNQSKNVIVPDEVGLVMLLCTHFNGTSKEQSEWSFYGIRNDNKKSIERIAVEAMPDTTYLIFKISGKDGSLIKSKKIPIFNQFPGDRIARAGPFSYKIYDDFDSLIISPFIVGKGGEVGRHGFIPDGEKSKAIWKNEFPGEVLIGDATRNINTLGVRAPSALTVTIPLLMTEAQMQNSQSVECTIVDDYPTNSTRIKSWARD